MAIVHDYQEECPTCKGAGIISVLGGLPEEAVVCLSCDGKGWRSAKVRLFNGRPPRRTGVKIIKRNLGACPPLDVERTGRLMTYDEFEEHFPAPRQP